MSLFATDGQLVLLTALIVLANSIAGVIGRPGGRWAWVLTVVIDFFKTASAYLIFLIFAQAGANKFALFEWLDTFAYLAAYTVEFGRLGANLSRLHPPTGRLVSTVNRIILRYFKHTGDNE